MAFNTDSESSSSAWTWLEQLVQEFGAQLFTLSFAITNDEQTARQAVIRTLASAIQYRSKTDQKPDQKWLFAQAIKESRKLERSAAQSPQRPVGSGEIDARIWRMLETFGWQERLLCAAYYGLQWPVDVAARLLDVDNRAVQRQVGIFEHQFNKLLFDLPAEISLGQSPLQLAFASLGKYYAPPSWTAQEITNFASDAATQADLAPPSIQRRLGRFWILLVPGGLIIAGLVVIAGLLAIRVMLSAQNLTGSEPPPTSQATLSMLMVRKEDPLRWFSSSKAIKRRMQESASLWKSVYLDAQLADYGPEGFIGAARIYQAQAWIAQPDQSIQLFGLLDGEPSSAFMLSSGRDYYLNPVTGTSYSRPRLSTPDSLIENSDLRRMIYPAVSRWSGDEGTLRVFNTAEVAGLPVLVVDWFNPFGEKEARLWLEVNTGILLRVQEFGGQNFDLLLGDFTVTSISLDQNFPPAQLAAAVSQVGSSAPNIQRPPGQQILPTPTPAVPANRRTSIPPDPAPSTLDLSASTLTFQFPINLETSSLVSGTAQVPIQLFSDGRWIAETRFGLPWMLRCDRSADGFRLAFNTGSDGTSVPDDKLRWFDLREPQKIYNPMAALHVDEFAFTQDGERIAVLGRASQSEPFGIYILEVPTGESKQIFSLEQGSGLTWSPDEEFLALVGSQATGEEQVALLIHVRTGQVAFMSPLPEPGEPLPPDWPMANWETVFPAKMGGMEVCSSPPQP